MGSHNPSRAVSVRAAIAFGDWPPTRQCDTCPFTSSDPDAIRGHEHGPAGGRGWLGEGERHHMTPQAAEDAGDPLWARYLDADR